MKVCRLIFRKDIGKLLLKVMYENKSELPTIEDELNTFAILNGYNSDALTIIDMDETHNEFQNAVTATNITLEEGNLVYQIIEPTPEQVEPNPMVQLNNKVDLLIQMFLEKEGII